MGLYFARRFSGGVPVNNDQTRTGMERNALMEVSIARAFQLAYFIHGDKETALNIATEAFAKLEVAAAAQDKRPYHTHISPDRCSPRRRASPALNFSSKRRWCRMALVSMEFPRRAPSSGVQ